MGIGQHKWWNCICFTDRLKAGLAVESRIAIGHDNIHPGVPQDGQSVTEQSLTKPLALMFWCHGERGKDKDNSLVLLEDQAGKDTRREQLAFSLRRHDVDVIRRCLREQPGDQHRYSATLLRPL